MKKAVTHDKKPPGVKIQSNETLYNAGTNFVVMGSDYVKFYNEKDYMEALDYIGIFKK